MSTSAIFTGLGFVLVSAQPVDASTILVTFNYTPLPGVGVYGLLSNHGDVRTVTVGAGPQPHQVYLYTNAPLTQDFWTLNYSGQQTGAPPVTIVPGAAYFWCGFGVAPTGTASPPFSGDNQDAAEFIRDHIPSSMKGNVWACLIAGLAASEQVAWDNAPLVDRQMFLSTASGVWLDRRAAGLGFERPAGVGMGDESFRGYAITVSSGQQTIIAFLEALRVFYGRAAVQASATSGDETYVLVDGDTLTFTLDGVQTVSVPFFTADFQTIGAAKAVEVASVLNREFSLRGVSALALVETNPTTSISRVVLYTGTLGARGSLQVASGAAQAALGLPTTLQRLLGQAGASYVLSRGKGAVEVFFPATTQVVARDTTTAAYLSDDYALFYSDGIYGVGLYGGGTPGAGVGPYLFEGVNKGLALTEVATVTATDPLLAGSQYRVVQVGSTTDFPDTEGWVVFGYGYEYQTGPVHYLGLAGPTAILLDVGFTFMATIPVGASVNMLVDDLPPVVSFGEPGDFWLTDSPAGRVAAMAAIDSIAAAGYEVTKTITYPGDVGLGNAGHPTHGTEAISDIVQSFAGSDVDGEVAAARSN